MPYVPQYFQTLVHCQNISQCSSSQISNFISFKTVEGYTCNTSESRGIEKYYNIQFLYNKVRKHYSEMYNTQYTSDN